MIHRRHLLAGAGSAAAAAALLPAPAARALDLRPMPLAVKLDDTLAPGHASVALIRWGDRVTFDAPPWDPRNPTVEAAERQFGWDARLIALIAPPPASDGVPRAVLAVAHQTVNPAMAFPGGADLPAVAAAMQGVSLLNLEKRGGRWLVVDGGYQSRRLTAATLCRVGGPLGETAGGSARGVLAVAGGCATPWGTLLLAEFDPTAWLARLRPVDTRFATAAGAARYGWVTELDPLDPQSVPAKRTALGRFAHGDAAAALSPDGRAVVYMTDRRPFGALFRFVSQGPANAPDALDRGTLAAARIEGERIRWLPLPAATAALLDPTAAAAAAGASTFDMPSGLALDPRGLRLYLACRGNPGRAAWLTDALNPRSGTPAGQVIEFTPAGGDHAGETAAAQILFLGRSAATPPPPPRQGARSAAPPPAAPAATAWPEHPDTLGVDALGRLWIGTNRGGQVGLLPDALYACALDGPARGAPLPLYGAPRGAAIGGAAASPDGGGTLFVMVRHPGAEPGASFERPATGWPNFQPGLPPRSTILAVTSEGGGPVGGA